MKEHLSELQLCHLSRQITDQLLFTEEDLQSVAHIRQCEECYQALLDQLAIDRLLDSAGAAVLISRKAARPLATVIRLLRTKASAVLEQLQEGPWSFDRPLVPMTARSESGEQREVEKLEDIENSRSFLACDGGRLVIQLDCPDSVPTVTLILPDGTEQSVSLEKQGSLYCAEITALPEGDYRLELKQ